MLEESYNDLFNEENIPESNFFKFETPGDKVAGILVETEDKPAKDNFPPQRVFTLKQADGTFVKVGISLGKAYVIARAAQARMGDLLGFEYKKDVPSQTKGFAPAKSIEVYVKHINNSEENADF